MGVDLGRGARVEILEEVGEVVAGKRRRMDFGSERLQEPGALLAMVTLLVPFVPVPFRQAADLNGELFERVGRCFVRADLLLIVIVVLLHKYIGIDCLILLDDRVCFQRVQHVGHMGALQGARATAGKRTLGRRVEAGEGARGMEIVGAWRRHYGQGSCNRTIVWLLSVS
jgi:hypothetical protein